MFSKLLDQFILCCCLICERIFIKEDRKIEMFRVFKYLLLVLFLILIFMEANTGFVSCFPLLKKIREKKSRKTSHLEMKIEHFCHCEIWESQFFNFTLLCRMRKGEKRFSIQLYCLVFQGDGHLSPGCSFCLPPCALSMKEEYLPKCVSVVFLFYLCSSCIVHAVELRFIICDFWKQSIAWDWFCGSLKLHIGGVCVTFWQVLFSAEELKSWFLLKFWPLRCWLLKCHVNLQQGIWLNLWTATTASCVILVFFCKSGYLHLRVQFPF